MEMNADAKQFQINFSRKLEYNILLMNMKYMVIGNREKFISSIYNL